MVLLQARTRGGGRQLVINHQGQGLPARWGTDMLCRWAEGTVSPGPRNPVNLWSLVKISQMRTILQNYVMWGNCCKLINRDSGHVVLLIHIIPDLDFTNLVFNVFSHLRKKIVLIFNLTSRYSSLDESEFR